MLGQREHRATLRSAFSIPHFPLLLEELGIYPQALRLPYNEFGHLHKVKGGLGSCLGVAAENQPSHAILSALAPCERHTRRCHSYWHVWKQLGVHI